MGTNVAYLMHHGIKGQKWGVRRFQNEDGSLTPAGEKRYSVKEALQTGAKNYAGNRTVGGIIGKTILIDLALGTGAGITRSLLNNSGHEYLANMVTYTTLGASAVNNAFGITAAVQRGRGRI